jgi:hypothetical protein
VGRIVRAYDRHRQAAQALEGKGGAKRPGGPNRGRRADSAREA